MYHYFSPILKCHVKLIESFHKIWKFKLDITTLSQKIRSWDKESYVFFIAAVNISTDDFVWYFDIDQVFNDAIEALRVSYKKMNPFCVPFATTNMGSAMLAMDLVSLYLVFAILLHAIMTAGILYLSF